LISHRRTRPTRRRRWGEVSGGYAASDFSPPAKTYVAIPAKMIVAAQEIHEPGDLADYLYALSARRCVHRVQFLFKNLGSCEYMPCALPNSIGVQKGTIMPEQDDIFDAIVEFNRSYLTLALRLLRADREEAKRQLGMSDETASIVSALTPAQIEVLSERRELFCEFRSESSPGRT